jgi:hypothetical protein
VVLFREVSHEPLRRRFDELVGEWLACDGPVRAHFEQGREPALRARRGGARRSVQTPGMKELADRISRARTSLENWLAVDDALRNEEFPDAQVLQDRMRVASARWPLGDELPRAVARPRAARRRLLRVGRADPRSDALNPPWPPHQRTSRTARAPGGAAAPHVPLHLRVPRARGALRVRSRRRLPARVPRDVLVPRRPPRSRRAVPAARRSRREAAAALRVGAPPRQRAARRAPLLGAPRYLERVLHQLEATRASTRSGSSRSTPISRCSPR